MEKFIWRLLTAIFILMVAVVLGVMAFMFEGVSLMVGLCVYGALICALVGVIKGILVTIDYHREYKE